MNENDFSPVSLAGYEDFYARWRATPQHSLDYTLANIWGWQQYFGLEWRFTDNLCWIRQTLPGPMPVCWAPIGDWNRADWDRELAQAPCRFIRVPETLMERWRVVFGDCRMTVQEDRGQWEYLYRQEELLALSGNRFHKKKNLYSQFIKTYGTPDYRPLDDAMVEDVLALQDDWCQWHECEDSPSLRAENDAINHVLSHWTSFPGMCGGSLYVDGRMVAFTVGEDLGNGMLGVHYEKGLNGFKGVYQAINREFARAVGDAFPIINRAQDLDEEGLRQAKMSYNPADFLRKYIVEIRPGQRVTA